MLIPSVSYILPLAVLCLPAATGYPHQDAAHFPQINLGYATHAPTYVNVTSSGLKYANYNNIRFAQPPVGPLRFRRPKTPPPKEYGVKNGSAPMFATDCVSAIPNIFPPQGLPSRSWGQEDCLFLNVRVPEGVKEGDNVPVVHWIHGSGYVYGSKDLHRISGDGSGLFEDMDRTTQKFIYVASNYRMGLYGWSSSPSDDIEANVGLHDVLAALRWTREYISKFGGDPRRITAFGESAGAGMLDLLLVAKNGKEHLPFDRAVIASPAVWPRKNPSRRQAVFDSVLKASKCGSADCLRNLPEKDLFKANEYLIVNATDGMTGALGPGPGFTPVVDGEYITDHISTILGRGGYNRGVSRVAASNMALEGREQAPTDNVPEIFPFLVRGTIPYASDETIQKIRSLYSYPADLPAKLAWDWVTDITYACNAYHTAKAYASKAQRYVMSVPPAIHALDQSYYFYQDNTTTPVASVKLAREFQEHVRRFVTDGKNNRKFPSLEDFPKYGHDETIFNITLDGWKKEKDPWETSRRCQILRDILTDPKNGA
ncbi:gut esterase 1 [Nannizzia gypsea CBS 118893]|uniref:Gut esterase 1 n=1 Tax=Arthroderma gypseum (strain ATCC MYA-4604 / CBS 118893) TaxID=535722 RepID=E5R2K1_ARTGP|nr:gut esterase 1 [Nannizzia gypsea CBS 118893]EFQ98659.1 gut esterase 1 [Nannizzia gypsea CBS 118893]